MPMLEYLNIQNIPESYETTHSISHSNDYCAVHLRQLIIIRLAADVQELKLLLKQTPNVRSLTISASYHLDEFNPDDWKNLIQSTLPHLNTFNFKFNLEFPGHIYPNEGSAIVEKFTRFQSDFWQEEHHCYTRYTLENGFATIYSTHYITKIYALQLNINRNYEEMTTNSTIFINTTDLTLPSDSINEKCHYYFSNVISLTTHNYDNFSDFDNGILKKEHIQSLKTIVNLSNLKHFYLALESHIVSSEALLEILKEAPQLSSLAIDPDQLISICDDDELCMYLNKMIKKLLINGGPSSILKNVIKFCEIFSNLDYLQCKTDEQDNILYLINHLPKLSILDVVYTISVDNPVRHLCQFENEAKRQNLMYRIVKGCPTHHERSLEGGVGIQVRIWTG
jgi:hypothetical protein